MVKPTTYVTKLDVCLMILNKYNYIVLFLTPIYIIAISVAIGSVNGGKDINIRIFFSICIKSFIILQCLVKNVITSC